MSIRGLTVLLAMCLVALSVLAAGVPSNAGEPRPVSDLLRRAQTRAGARQFEQLLGAMEGKPAWSNLAGTDKAPLGEKCVVVKAKTEVVAAQTFAPPPVTVSSVPRKPSSQAVSIKTKSRELELDDQMPHVFAKKAVKTWLRPGRDWVGLVGNGF